jgi:hypothetical protein
VVGIRWDDIDATADDRADQAFVPEHLDSLLGGAASYAVLLRKTIDRRQWTARRNLAALDLASQDRGKLHVDRHVALVIDRHKGDCR